VTTVTDQRIGQDYQAVNHLILDNMIIEKPEIYKPGMAKRVENWVIWGDPKGFNRNKHLPVKKLEVNKKTTCQK